MITEDYVSFGIAKLLKEKGFDEPCRAIYALIVKKNLEIYESASAFSNTDIITKNLRAAVCTCPTLQMVMKWLREVHHIYIQINLYLVPKGYGADIIHVDSMDTLAYVRKEDDSQYDTYEQAAEAAIKYYLENLI